MYRIDKKCEKLKRCREDQDGGDEETADNPPAPRPQHQLLENPYYHNVRHHPRPHLIPSDRANRSMDNPLYIVHQQQQADPQPHPDGISESALMREEGEAGGGRGNIQNVAQEGVLSEGGDGNLISEGGVEHTSNDSERDVAVVEVGVSEATVTDSEEIEPRYHGLVHPSINQSGRRRGRSITIDDKAMGKQPDSARTCQANQLY